MRTAEIDDADAIDRLMARNGLEPHRPDDWRRLWADNPATEATTDIATGWVLETTDRDVVGYLGSIPLEYDFCGQPIRAATTHAWVVDEAHRNRSIALVQRFLTQPGVELLLNTTANFEASRVFDAMRVPRVPTPDYDVALVWITRTLGFAEAVLRQRGVPLPGLGRYPVSLGLALRRGLSRAGRAQGVAVRRLERFDSRFDDTWRALRGQAKGLRCVRNTRNLAWRFERDIDDSTLVYVVESNDEITAYCIVRDQHNASVGLRRRRLVDLQPIADPGTIGPLVERALADCRADGIHVLEAVGFAGRTRRRLEELSHVRRRLPAWMFYYRAVDEHLARQLADPRVWDPCFYDGDGVL